MDYTDIISRAEAYTETSNMFNKLSDEHKGFINWVISGLSQGRIGQADDISHLMGLYEKETGIKLKKPDPDK